MKNRYCLPLFLFSSVLSFSLSAQTLPALPQIFLETCVPYSTDTLRVCNGAGCDYGNSQLQQALNAAQPGTVILLEPGVSYVGPFTLKEKPDLGDDRWIVVRTAAPDTLLPDADHRITPADTTLLPRIESKPFLQAILTEPRAHHWYFLGVEFAAQAFSYNIVAIGNGETSEADLPHDFTFDRVYAHGHPTEGSRRAFAGNGKRIALVNSWVSDCKEVGADSQAFCAWNGTIFKIVNNYLEGAGENVMFGGAATKVPDLVISDIEVRGNHFFKPTAWASWSPDYAGKLWSVKNLFELKHAQRVLVEGNVLEQNWVQAQTGFAVLFTPRTEGGAVPWAKVQDVTWRHNIIRHTTSGFNVSGTDDALPTERTARILLQDNLIEDLSPSWGNGDGRVFQVLHGPEDLSIEHNTVFNTGNTFVTADSPNEPATHFIFRDNIVRHAQYGLHGSGYGVGNTSLAQYFPQAVFTHNVIEVGDPNVYPANNFFPATMQVVGFVNFNGGLGGDYHLLPTSPYALAATDGTDIGANLDSVLAYTAGAVAGFFPGCPAAPVGVATPKDGLSVQLFPNPGGASGFEVRGLGAGAIVEVWDGQGALMHCSKGGAVVDAGGWPAGIYFVRVFEWQRVKVLRWVKG